MREHVRPPVQVLAQTLKRLYPANPDVVLGREARIVLDEFVKRGYVVVFRGCAHEFDPECARCETLAHYQPWRDKSDTTP